MHLSHRTSGSEGTMQTDPGHTPQKTTKYTRTRPATGRNAQKTADLASDAHILLASNCHSLRSAATAAQIHPEMPNYGSESDDDWGGRVRNAVTAQAARRPDLSRDASSSRNTRPLTVPPGKTKQTLTVSEQIISKYYNRPLHCRFLSPEFAAHPYLFANPSSNPIYLHRYPYPNLRYLQRPLSFAYNPQAGKADILENYFLTGIHSESSPDRNAFYIWVLLYHDDPEQCISRLTRLLEHQLEQLGAQYPQLHISSEGLEGGGFRLYPKDEPRPFDDPEFSMQNCHLPEALALYEYKYRFILHSNTPAAQGLRLLAKVQRERTPGSSPVSSRDGKKKKNNGK